jgi:hypothetical protein
VIHLLAELIENATTLSPPFTQVRVSGETVASGFAIEIEDRGLGMTPQRLAELNERLAQPPEINPTNTEQLGLFVVGQLARRHGISVTLRQSPYGGTTAVALIPDRLIVVEGPTAITAGGPPVAAGVPTPNSGYGMSGAYPGNGAYAGSGAYASNGTYGPDGSYGSYGSYGSHETYGAYVDPGAGTGAFQPPYGADGSGLPVPSFSPSGYPGGPADPGNTMGGQGGYPGYGGYPEPTPPQAPGAPANWQGQGGWQGQGSWQGQGGVPGGSDIRISGPMRLRNATGGTGAAGAPSAGRGRHGSAEVPVVTGVPVTRPGAPEAPPFDVFTPLHRSEQGGAAAPGTGDAPDAPYAQSYAEPRPGTSDPQPSYGPGYGQPAAGQPAYSDGNLHGDGPGVQQAHPGGSGDTDYKGLPRRVRQASLAPQLRGSTAAGSTGTTGGTTGAGVPPAASASLSDMRNTLSAMQRGWQQGRSQGQRDTEGGGDGE